MTMLVVDDQVQQESDVRVVTALGQIPAVSQVVRLRACMRFEGTNQPFRDYVWAVWGPVQLQVRPGVTGSDMYDLGH